MLEIKGTKQKKAYPYFKITVKYMIGDAYGNENVEAEINDSEENRKGIEWFMRVFNKITTPRNRGGWHWDDLQDDFRVHNISHNDADWLTYSIKSSNTWQCKEDKEKSKADFEKTPYCHEHPLLDLYALYKDKEPEYSWRTVEKGSVVYIDDRGIKHYVCVNDDKR